MPRPDSCLVVPISFARSRHAQIRQLAKSQNSLTYGAISKAQIGARRASAYAAFGLSFQSS